MRKTGSTPRIVVLFMLSSTLVAAEQQGGFGWTNMMLPSTPMEITGRVETSNGTVVRKLSLLTTYSSRTGSGFLAEPNGVNGTLLFRALNTPDKVDYDSLDGGMTTYKAGTLPGTEGKRMEIFSGVVQIEMKTTTRDGVLSRELLSMHGAPGASFTSVGDQALIEIPQGTTLATYTAVGDRWKVVFLKDKADPKEGEPDSVVWLTRGDLDQFLHSSVPISGQDGAIYAVFGAYGKMQKGRSIGWLYRTENNKQLVPLMTSFLPLELQLDQAAVRSHARLKAHLFLALQKDVRSGGNEDNDDAGKLAWSKIMPIGLIVRSDDARSPNESDPNVINTMRFTMDRTGLVNSVCISAGNGQATTWVPIEQGAYHAMEEALQKATAHKAEAENVQAGPNTRIVLVDKAAGIVYLDVGADDGVRPGFTYTVYQKGTPSPKEGKPKARVEVLAVQTKFATARIVGSESSPIGVGDLAVAARGVSATAVVSGVDANAPVESKPGMPTMPSKLREKVQFYRCIELLGENTAQIEDYDVEKGQVIRTKVFNPSELLRGCAPVSMASGGSLGVIGSGSFDEKGLPVLAPGSYFHHKPTMVTIPDLGGPDNQISVLRFYTVTEEGLVPAPFGFMSVQNQLSNRLYFGTDARNNVIDWGVELNGKKTSLPMTIPAELNDRFQPERSAIGLWSRRLPGAAFWSSVTKREDPVPPGLKQ